MLKPRYGKTFRDYAINTFVPYVSSLLRQVERADLVWDRYFAEYLQNCTRGKRGVGVRRKLADNCLLSWIVPLFMKCMCIGNLRQSGSVSRKWECSYQRTGLEISSLVPCNMEEADEWTFVHVKQASQEHAHIMVKQGSNYLFRSDPRKFSD